MSLHLVEVVELGDACRWYVKLRSMSTVVDAVQGFYLENATADLTFAASGQHRVCGFGSVSSCFGSTMMASV